MKRYFYYIGGAFLLICFCIYFFKIISINKKLSYLDKYSWRVHGISMDIFLYYYQFRSLPDSLEDFKGEFGNRIKQKFPKDVFSPKGNPIKYTPIIYKGARLGFIIYSVGVDGDDDSARILYSNRNKIYNPFKNGDILLGNGGYRGDMSTRFKDYKSVEIKTDTTLLKLTLKYNADKMLKDSAKKLLQKKDVK